MHQLHPGIFFTIFLVLNNKVYMYVIEATLSMCLHWPNDVYSLSAINVDDIEVNIDQSLSPHFSQTFKQGPKRTQISKLWWELLHTKWNMWRVLSKNVKMISFFITFQKQLSSVTIHSKSQPWNWKKRHKKQKTPLEYRICKNAAVLILRMKNIIS